jgi:hypothetical protein
MIKNLQVTVIVAMPAIILLGALPSLALLRADSGPDNSGGSSDNGGSGSTDNGGH